MWFADHTVSLWHHTDFGLNHEEAGSDSYTGTGSYSIYAPGLP